MKVFDLTFMSFLLNKKHQGQNVLGALAADEGFEPSQTESESGVLPLHKSAKRICYYNDFEAFVKSSPHIF